ncbi:MAG: hypothetical protein ACOCXQ_01360 [Patescibacteria group bacterium]
MAGSSVQNAKDLALKKPWDSSRGRVSVRLDLRSRIDQVWFDVVVIY